jgi:beta-mannosidase
VLITWTCAAVPAGAADDPSALAALDVDWLPAPVPGTAASALRAAGRWPADALLDLDALDWWWRGRLEVEASPASGASVDATLRVGGLATIADLWLDELHLHHGENQFRAHRFEVALPPGPHELAIRCAALAPRLAVRRPRGRWRTALVEHQNLRWIRTSFAGRMPGWWGSAPAVGPWRGVDVVTGPRVVSSELRAALAADGTGRLAVRAELAGGPAGVVGALLLDGDVTEELGPIAEDGSLTFEAEVVVPSPERWWPHTHGAQPLHDVAVAVAGTALPLGRTGFRDLTVDRSGGGFRFVVNGVPILARGAVWIPPDPVAFGSSEAELRPALELVRSCGMNMVRVSGTTAYESPAFHDLCDELGILVWQDLMLANVDLPDDNAYADDLLAEVADVLDRIATRPSTAVLCGSSELEQQAAMLGLPPDRWTPRLLVDDVPALVHERAPDLTYLTSTPTGGTFPFTVDTGVTHYYGVGAYRRTFDDVRRAGARFAPECLAFANVGEQEAADPGTAAWKSGVPFDRGAMWDFEDVRDHYVATLFDVDPEALRTEDADRYLDLGRVATGLAMSAVYSEWSRPGSTSGGGLVWTFRDVAPGAGWGIIDHAGRPKPAWWFLRRALAPVALLATDEGLNGLHLHVRNDRAVPLVASLVVDLFVRGELRVETAATPLDVAPQATTTVIADALFDGFRDLTYAYRFGALEHDVIAASLVDADGVVLSRLVHLPGGVARPREDDLGLTATARPSGLASDDRDWTLDVTSRRFAQAVAIDVPGYDADERWFDVPPGSNQVVVLRPQRIGSGPPAGHVRALNGRHPVEVVTGP